MRGAVEILGIALVVAGLLVAWLPLGLLAGGAALILAAHAPPEARPADQPNLSPAELRRRAS